MKKKILWALALAVLISTIVYGLRTEEHAHEGVTKLHTEEYLAGSEFESILQLAQYLHEPPAGYMPFQGQEIQVTSGITPEGRRGDPAELTLQGPVALLFQEERQEGYFAQIDGMDIADTLAEARTLLVFPPMSRSSGGNTIAQCLFYDILTGECFHTYSLSYADKTLAMPALLAGCVKANLTSRREECSALGILALRARLGTQDDFSGLLQLAEVIQPDSVETVPSHTSLSELGYRLEDLCALVLAFDSDYQGDEYLPTLPEVLNAGHFSVITGFPSNRTLLEGRQRLMAFASLVALRYDGGYSMSDTEAYLATYRYDVLDYDTGAYMLSLYQTLEAPSFISTSITKDYVFKTTDWWTVIHRMFPEETTDA